MGDLFQRLEVAAIVNLDIIAPRDVHGHRLQLRGIAVNMRLVTGVQNLLS